jgi:hypothetical protein
VKPLENHKIITLAIGIFVAIVIAITVFTNHAAEPSSLSRSIDYKAPLFVVTKCIESAAKIIF